MKIDRILKCEIEETYEEKPVDIRGLRRKVESFGYRSYNREGGPILSPHTPTVV